MDVIKMKELEIKGKMLRSGSRPLVCVPLIGVTDERIMEHLEEIIHVCKETQIDIVEFRADFYNELQDLDKLEILLDKIRGLLEDKLLLFTIRSPREGGQKRDYSPKSIEEINSFVIDNKLADMVDVELYSVDDETRTTSSDIAQPAIIKLAKERGVKIIMSNHDFEKTPSKEEIVARLGRMQELGADVAKLAAMPTCKEDVDTLILATVSANVKHSKTPIVTMSMGELGVFSRILGEMNGSAFTFGAVGEVSAPGQLEVKALNAMLDMIHSNCV